jgi:uncharacterized protein involved in exopolysaccharide biosynthesis
MTIHTTSIDISGLISYLKAKVLALISIALFISACSFILSLTIEDYYVSSARLTVSEDRSAPSGGSGSAGLLGSISGFGMAGSPLNDKILQVQEIINSRDFFRTILSKPGLHDLIVYPELIDNIENHLALIHSSSESKEGPEPAALPPMDGKFFQAHSIFMKNFNFKMNLESEYYSISYKHKSPVIAKEILDLIISELNRGKRQEVLQEANLALSYLYEELNKATNAQVRGSVSKLIEIQLKTKMIANMGDNYIIKVIDAPFAPLGKTGPLRLFVVFTTFFVSLFLLIPIYAFQYARKNN